MSLELNLRFPDPASVIVRLGEEETVALGFASPLQQADHEDLRWYLEVYAAHYTTDVDDQRADSIAAKLPVWGRDLFNAVFSHPAAHALFLQFQGQSAAGRLLTISAEAPEILSLPWELLHDQTTFLVHDPHLSIRRRLPGATGGRAPQPVVPKPRLRLLFAVSRPEGAGFIDPRSDPKAVMDALDEHAPGRVEVEFLRPATLENLRQRLKNRGLPPVDILHFDGHGYFDRTGKLPEMEGKAGAGQLKQDKPRSGPNTGYLLFENAKGQKDYISAAELGDLLHRRQVSLVVLSACQSAAMGGDDPMGSVAARLIKAGIPGVLAMSHSVLVAATRLLFGEFYQNLASGWNLGEALDEARRALSLNPRRHEVQRGARRHTLELQDWFVPALYQAGGDLPLFTGVEAGGGKEDLPVRHNLPGVQEAGFFGRSRELWDLERWFVEGTRRISITGFGGVGKTFLAQEAGRWWLRTGLFQYAAFVDYRDYQGVDPVGAAVATLGTVLNQSLIDAAAAAKALQGQATLIVLDNLEALNDEMRRELLDAALHWSGAGESRVLITTRTPDLHHPAYPLEKSRQHRPLPLGGLHEEDALAYFQALMALPPTPEVTAPAREGLLQLLGMVGCHPLSLNLLAHLLKTSRLAEVAEGLEKFLQQNPDDPLLASLNLSLARVPEEARQWLPRLAVFQGGAMENVLLEVTGLGLTEEDQQGEMARLLLAALEGGDLQAGLEAQGLEVPEGAEIPQEWLHPTPEFLEKLRQLAAAAPEPAPDLAPPDWPALREVLVATALIRPEALPGVKVPYLRFHPTLAPALKSRLSPKEEAGLRARHRRAYYRLANFLYHLDKKYPHQARAVAQRELPNLLPAVQGALEAGEDGAVEFADSVIKFLDNFGLRRDRADLSARVEKIMSRPGSRDRHMALSYRGKHLFNEGRYQEAAALFQEVLTGLEGTPSYEQVLTLARLGRCLRFQGRPNLAAARYRQALEAARQLEPTDGVQREMGVLQTDLGDARRHLGDYAGARQAYEASRESALELGDRRGVAVVDGQLGTLALEQGQLEEAAQRYRQALAAFQGLKEPAGEATAWHQLGRVYEEARQWQEAESAYRQAALISENLGLISGNEGAAITWGQIARVCEDSGNPREAEAWYDKALKAFRQAGDQVNLSKTLSNLAGLLQEQPGRLAEARDLAAEALAIKQTLDPAAAEIWKIYQVLAEIAGKEGRPVQAREYLAQARRARAASAGGEHELQRHLPLILGVALAVRQPEHRQELEAIFQQMESQGWGNLAAALRRVLAGARDEEDLVQDLDMEDSLVVMAVLQALEDPEKLQSWLAAPGGAVPPEEDGAGE